MTTGKIRRVQFSSGEEAYLFEQGGRWYKTPWSFAQLSAVVMSGGTLSGVLIEDDATYRVLAPVTPTKVICVGLNYRRHAEEMGKEIPPEPLIFMKPPTTVIGSGDSIELPEDSQLVHHEAELAIVIGAKAKRVAREQAGDVILGFTCANDVTARDIQRREKRYTRGKGFDTFCPLGPDVVLYEGFDPIEHEVMCRVNGEERQRSQMDDMICDVAGVVAFVSRVMTLFPGDVILTGTPAGVGPLVEGDVVEIEVGGIGVLRNEVVVQG